MAPAAPVLAPQQPAADDDEGNETDEDRHGWYIPGAAQGAVVAQAAAAAAPAAAAKHAAGFQKSAPLAKLPRYTY